ncbi:hypothetical protein QOT17_015311 [Balamuthia mandrillaris]
MLQRKRLARQWLSALRFSLSSQRPIFNTFSYSRSNTASPHLAYLVSYWFAFLLHSFVGMHFLLTIKTNNKKKEPYYARSEDYFKEPAKQRQRHAVLMFGFGLPFALVLSVPFVGVLCWGLAQGSTAALVVRLLQREAGEEEESGGAESGKRGGEGGEATKKKVVRRGIQSSRVSVLV